jgi:hypothetical protein
MPRKPQRRVGLAKLKATRKGSECIFCGDPAAPKNYRNNFVPGSPPAKSVKIGWTCGDPICKAAYHRYWRRDRQNAKVP